MQVYDTQPDAVQAVLSGRAYATSPATPRSPRRRSRIRSWLSYLHSTGLVWAAPCARTIRELRNQIQDALDCMKKDGTIAKLHEKWFGMKPAPGSAAVTHPGLRRARHAGLRPDAAQAEVRLSPATPGHAEA